MTVKSQHLYTILNKKNKLTQVQSKKVCQCALTPQLSKELPEGTSKAQQPDGSVQLTIVWPH